MDNELDIMALEDDIFTYDGKIVTGLKDGVSVSELIIPEGVIEIAANAFEENTEITSVLLPESLEKIGESAFAVTSLTEITIPGNVTEIGAEAFYGCENLAKVKVESLKLKKCGYGYTDGIYYDYYDNGECGNFTHCNIESITLPEGMKEIPAGMFYYAGMQDNINVTIPASVKVVGASAFANAEKLSGVTFAGNSVTEIKNDAFTGTSISEIQIPSGVVSIGDCAFENCTKLNKMIIPASVKTIGDMVITGNDYLKTYVIRNSYAHKWATSHNMAVVLTNGIIYNLNGGSNHPKNGSIYEDGEVVVFQTPTRQGYTFKGWYGDSKFKKKITDTAGKTGNLKIYAKWQVNDYTITYESNGGIMVKNPASYNILKSVKLKAPKKSGSIFAGWKLQRGEEELGIVKNISKGTYGDLTLTAQWRESQYHIKFAGNGGKTGDNQAYTKTTFSYSANEVLLKNKFYRAGYEFTGWNAKKNGKGKTYTDGQIVSKLSAKENSTVTLYAMWTPIKYQITYEDNGESIKHNNPAYSTVNKEVKLKKATWTGYTFGGWFLDEECTRKITKLGKNILEDNTLYAKWTENVYKVVFNMNGGKGSVRKQITVPYTGTIDLPEEGIVSRNGYILKEWNSKKNGKGISYGLGDTTFKADNLPSKNKGILTLYAIWSKK